MDDAPTPIDSQTEATPTATQEVAEEDEPEPTVTVQNGRRRGRRRVMKTKKVKDEDGYLGKLTSNSSSSKLTLCSNQRGGSLGVFLRGGAATEEAQTQPYQVRGHSKREGRW